jgi:hypothetical protein
MRLTISKEVDSDFDQNIHKVFFQGKRTIVSGTINERGQVTFKKGKSGAACYSKGYMERVADADWEHEDWLDTEVAKAEEILILEECVKAYKKKYKTFKKK